MTTKAPRLIVIGAGITGLSAAYAALRLRPETQVTVLERSGHLGGCIVTEQRDGFVLDGGPDSFLKTKPAALALCRQLGLEGELISVREAGRNVYVAHDGKLLPLPPGMALAVPTRLAPLLTTPLLSPAGKLRMLGDLLLPAHFLAPDEDESIAAFVARRFGREAAERLAAPLLGGIYSGDAETLSLRSTFPQLAEYERAHGSVVFGMFAAQVPSASHGGSRVGQLRALLRWMRRGDKLLPSPFASFPRGMGQLVEALSAKLPEGSLRRGAEVVRLLPPATRDQVWTVELAGGERLSADGVLLAAPARVCAALVPDAELSRELSAIPQGSTATVFVGLDRAAVAHPLDGSGFVVPKGQGRILAATWVSSKWEGRAPAGKVLLRTYLGGARDPELLRTASDADLVGLARAELERLMGPLGQPELTRVFRYVDSRPQPVTGHAARLERIRAGVRRLPRLELAGAAYDGVGIPDCIRQAEAAVSRLFERCSVSPSLASHADTL
jgi:protoporphyrinogen/coproporphyrinogen III oxidase